MKTLQAQRLKKQAEHEYKHRQALLEQILEEGKAEAIKLAGLLSMDSESNFMDEAKQIFEEYKEDDAAVYFEKGFLER